MPEFEWGQSAGDAACYPGILEALARLPDFHAVVTNKPGPSARRLVQTLGIGGHVQGVVGGGDVPSRKPDPAAGSPWPHCRT